MQPRKSLLALIENGENIALPLTEESDHGEWDIGESCGKVVHQEIPLGHSGISGIILTNFIQSEKLNSVSFQ